MTAELGWGQVLPWVMGGDSGKQGRGHAPLSSRHPLPLVQFLALGGAHRKADCQPV